MFYRHYEQFLDPFDQTYTKGVPFSFIVDGNEVISGWDEGVKQMTLNEKSVWIIPYAKGYGERGAGASIPGKADLKFEVRLLHIHKPFQHFTIENEIKNKLVKLRYTVNGIGSRFYKLGNFIICSFSFAFFLKRKFHHINVKSNKLTILQ